MLAHLQAGRDLSHLSSEEEPIYEAQILWRLSNCQHLDREGQNGLQMRLHSSLICCVEQDILVSQGFGVKVG